MHVPRMPEEVYSRRQYEAAPRDSLQGQEPVIWKPALTQVDTRRSSPQLNDAAQLGVRSLSISSRLQVSLGDGSVSSPHTPSPITKPFQRSWSLGHARSQPSPAEPPRCRQDSEWSRRLGNGNCLSRGCLSACDRHFRSTHPLDAQTPPIYYSTSTVTRPRSLVNNPNLDNHDFFFFFITIQDPLAATLVNYSIHDYTLDNTDRAAFSQCDSVFVFNDLHGTWRVPGVQKVAHTRFAPLHGYLHLGLDT